MYHAMVVPAVGDPVLVVRGMEEPAVAASSWVTGIYSYQDVEEPILASQRALKALELDGGVSASTIIPGF